MIGCCELDLFFDETEMELPVEIEEQINVVFNEEISEELEKIKEQLKETETALENKINELESVQGELTETQATLSQTQADLTETTANLQAKTDELNAFTEEVNGVKEGLKDVAQGVDPTFITDSTQFVDYPEQFEKVVASAENFGHTAGVDEENLRWTMLVNSATATEEDVAKGKTFVDDYGEIKDGKMSIVKRILQARGNYVSYLFNGCMLESLDDYFYDYSDTENATGEAAFMFSNTSYIKSVPLFDMGQINSTRSMFQNSIRIEIIPALDMRNITNTGTMLSNCRGLTTCLVKNIKVDLQVGSGTSWGHLLTFESLIHLLGELRDTGSIKTFTVGSANLEKLAGVYVKIVEITDEMRANDDLIDEKAPFLVCESTEVGALSVEEYLLSKNWQIM